MCKNCEEVAKKRAADVGSQLRVDRAEVDGQAYVAAPPKRRIEITEAENGFLVTFRKEPTAYALMSTGLVGLPSENVHVAKNLEEATDIILSVGRNAR